MVTDEGAVDIGSGKRRALLANLLIHANEVVPAERLIDELWNEHPPATAAKSVQVYVSQLRKALAAGGDVLETRSSGYVMSVEPAQLDICVFEQRLTAAEAALAGGDPKTAAAEAGSALELWRGRALHDVAYESFAQPEVARLEELRLVALETRIEAELALGAHSRVAGDLESLVAAYPLRERFRAQLMVALYRCDQQSQALDVYREGRRLLLDELGLEPSPALRELEQQVLTHSGDLAAPRPPQRPRSPAAADAPRLTSPRRTRAAWLILAGAVLILGAGAIAIAERSTTGGAARAVAIDAAPNSMVAFNALRSRPVAAVPLPGRPTDVAIGRDRVWVTTVDSPSLTSIDARTQRIVKTIPLRGHPDAVAVNGDSVWIADGSGGVLARVRAGYATVLERIRFPRVRLPAGSAERLRLPRTTLASTRGAVWLTSRSPYLLRVESGAGRAARIAVGGAADAVASGAGAVWVLSTRSATVLRVDPVTGRVTDRIPVVARHGPGLPAPTAIAAGAHAVWVLNRNSATLTRINPQTRGVEMTIELGIDRVPADLAASGGTAWVANFDGSLSRVSGRSSTAKNVWVGGSLERIAATPAKVWATTTALDQKLPGGSG